jgi:hypothetical protein
MRMHGSPPIDVIRSASAQASARQCDHPMVHPAPAGRRRPRPQSHDRGGGPAVRPMLSAHGIRYARRADRRW